ncbi:MAG: protein kinase [Pleurocapsa minor GSE-CHR-MK-17-07R]|jgi:serine/threonine-protein kinase|nr:protein kinase [Pleurocapsa minor GSE-CHR-MK 17-07R]
MQSSDPNIGRRLRDFVVGERIGRGGMATVYRARQRSVNRDVALKVIPLDPTTLDQKNEFQQRFEQEANLIASLEHLHILPIYDYGVVDGDVAFLAMRLLRGGSLADLIKAGPLEFNRAADIFTQIARGLGYAHLREVIHRDLKPSNIMLDESGNAYLTDFGLAKLLKDSKDITRTGSIVGTPVYMSPEQLRGEDLDTRSDIYSMGVLLYHMMAGKPPFDSDDFNMVSVIYQHLEKIPVPPSVINPAVTPALEDVILRALDKDRIGRYERAEDMAQALNDALGRQTRISTGKLPRPKPEKPVESGASASVSPASPPTIAAQAPALKAPDAPAVQRMTVGDLLKKDRRVQMAVIAGALVLVAAVVLGLSGRGNAQPDPPATGPMVLVGQVASLQGSIPTQAEIDAAVRRAGEDGMVAYVACTQSTDYHATQTREIGDMARAYGLEYRVYDGNADPYLQLTLIERARADGAVGLIVCPLDPSVLANALESLREARIPTVYMAATMPMYTDGVLIAGDDYQMGYAAGMAGGEIVNRYLGGSAQAIVLDYPSFPTLMDRAQGLVDGMLSVAPNAEVVANTPGATRENGRTNIARLIEEGLEFNLILSINDAGAFGAIEAMQATGISPDDVYISSVDAEPVAQQYIRDDYYIRASLEVNRRDFSIVAINALVKMLAGTVVPETYLVPPGSIVTQDSLQVSSTVEGES